MIKYCSVDMATTCFCSHPVINANTLITTKLACLQRRDNDYGTLIPTFCCISIALAQYYSEYVGLQSVAKLEQLSAEGEPPHRAAVLGDYLDNFNNMYCDRMADPDLNTDALTQLSFRLLIDLLFYSAAGRERQL